MNTVSYDVDNIACRRCCTLSAVGQFGRYVRVPLGWAREEGDEPCSTPAAAVAFHVLQCILVCPDPHAPASPCILLYTPSVLAEIPVGPLRALVYPIHVPGPVLRFLGCPVSSNTLAPAVARSPSAGRGGSRLGQSRPTADAPTEARTSCRSSEASAWTVTPQRPGCASVLDDCACRDVGKHVSCSVALRR